MTHVSATAFIVWSVLSTSLGAFLLGHLWRFDQFKCLRWRNTPYNGAFKRIMTYTYLVSIPLLIAFSYGFAYIKYKEGWLDFGGIILPKPYTSWLPKHRAAIFPLMLVFSFAWSLEMVTHLEELCFWYFLLTAGPSQPDWFRSIHFRVWAVGSVIAMVFLPVVAGVWRSEPLACEARIYTAGSIGDLVLTLAFIPILWRFPSFIRKVKAEGVDSSVIIRLRKFYELNVVRIIFRFLMQIPLLSLGADGLTPHTHVNESLFWTDLLSTVAALGCVFSSICTLLIFFPRSYEAEYQAREASNELSSRQTHEPYPSRSLGDRSRSPPTMEADKDSSYFAEDRYGRSDGYSGGYDSGNRKSHGIGQRTHEQTSRVGRARTIGKGRRLGMGVNEILSRRLMRLPIPRRKTTGSGGDKSFGVGTPSLSQREQEYEMEAGTGTRIPMRKESMVGSIGSRTTRTGRASGSVANSNTGLVRKGTYLLTDSPVLRAKALREAELRDEGREAEVGVEEAVGYALELGLGAAAYNHEDADVEEFALNAPSSPLSQLTPPPPPSAPPVYRTPPTKSASLSTTGTGRRALPIPPGQTDPLGAAPAYYPPEGPEADRSIEMGVKTGFTGATYAVEAPDSTSTLLTTQRPTYTREPTDMYAPARDYGVSIVPAFESSVDQLGSRRTVATNAAVLTAANVSRHNHTVLAPATRASTLNPLVHTFTSPIDFLVRRERENGGASGSHGQAGWAV